jgi:hypothetical protein
MGLMLPSISGLVAFFVVMPYSKMVHGMYQGIALLPMLRRSAARACCGGGVSRRLEGQPFNLLCPP